MNISVIGNGRWGSFIAWYLDYCGHNVRSFGQPNSPHTIQFQETRSNGMVTFGESIEIITDLNDALRNDVIVISIPSQNLRGLMSNLHEMGVRDKLFILCMKGLEVETGKRLTQIVEEETKGNNRTAVWIGPGHVQEFLRGTPNCMVIDTNNEDDKELLIEEFSSDLIRFYYGEDLIGNEIGAAAKNVVGIAAGMLDGLGISALKGALMSRGTREFSRLISALGGNELSAYGLCHLGDYEATVFSQFSNNRMFGEKYVQGESFEKLAEGYYTTKALLELAKKTDTELPITNAVYQILYHDKPAKEELDVLFSRDLKQEFL